MNIKQECNECGNTFQKPFEECPYCNSNRVSSYREITRKFKCLSGDAEIQAIQIIPQLFEDLQASRAIGIMEYMIGRYKSGDTFGK